MESKRSTILCQKFDEFFENKDFKGLRSYFHDISKGQINSESWELIPELCKNLNSSEEEIDQICNNFLHLLASTAEAITIFRILNDELQKSICDEIFCKILRNIPIILLRIVEPRKEYYERLTCTVYTYIEAISLPQKTHLKVEKYEVKETNMRLGVILISVVSFLKDLFKHINVINFNNSQSKIIEEEFSIFVYFILNIFESPLSNLNISLRSCNKCQRFHHGSTNCINANDLSEIKKASKLLVDFINEMKPDTLKFLSNLPIRNSLIGSSILIYFVYSEDIKPAKYPYTYSHQYVFETCSKYILILLEGDQPERNNKGLSLFCQLLSKLQPNSWTVEFLEWPPLKQLLQNVVIIAAKTTLATQMEQSLCIITTIVEAFTPCVVRYSLLHMLLLKSPEKVVIGHIISLIKKEFDERLVRFQNVAKLNDDFELKTTLNEEDILNFKNNQLLVHSNEEDEMFKKLLSLIFSLPNGEKSNLFICSERIIGTLNLLKYLTINDNPNMDCSQIWTLMPHIEEKYIPILGRIIEITKAQCVLEKKNYKEAVSRIRLEIKELIKSQKIQECSKDGDKFPVEISDKISNSLIDYQNVDLNKCVAPIGTKESVAVLLENKKNKILKYEKDLFFLEKSFSVLDGIEAMHTQFHNIKFSLKN